MRPKKKIVQRPLFWITLLIILLLGTGSYFILFFPKFQVSNIKIAGYQKVSNQDIEDLVLDNVKKKFIGNDFIGISSKSIFIASTAKIENSVYKSFPAIEEVAVQKELPNTLRLTIKERQPVAIFCQDDDHCFFIDKNGVIFERIQDISGEYMMLKLAANAIDIELGKEVVSPSTIDVVKKVEYNLESNFGIDIREILVSSSLIVRTAENWDIYFNPDSDINLQIAKLNSLLESEITQGQRKSLQYIYLQYKDRAYYK